MYRDLMIFILFFKKKKTHSPALVKDQVALLDSIYENPAYLEDHANPLEQFLSLEETIAVSNSIHQGYIYICMYIYS